MGRIIGIDLGTTNSVVAVMEGKEPKVIPNDEGSAPMYLGIDLGTSEVKVLLLASDGRVIGTAGSPFTVSRPHQRWAEQNPEDWWAGTRATSRKFDSET